MKKIFRWSTIVSLLIAVAVISQYQTIYDWVRLYGYDPPPAVASLADDIKLTDKSRRLFYVNHPTLQDRASFNTSCSKRGEHTIVLGCYYPVDRGIFLFNVGDDRLSGVNQVTAAHEMLHAAYDRLSPSNQSKVDAQLQEFFKTGSYDERIKSIVASYQESEPDDVVNEMHSIFATEIQDLPKGLEQYYSQYFTDRAKVVAYATDYQSEFTSRQSQVSTYDSELKQLKIDIDATTASLDIQEIEIAELRSQLNRDRGSDDIAAYNRNVPTYNARIDRYNKGINTARSLINAYNLKVADRNELALQVTNLANSIDSSYQPIEQ